MSCVPGIIMLTTLQASSHLISTVPWNRYPFCRWKNRHLEKLTKVIHLEGNRAQTRSALFPVLLYSVCMGTSLRVKWDTVAIFTGITVINQSFSVQARTYVYPDYKPSWWGAFNPWDSKGRLWGPFQDPFPKVGKSLASNQIHFLLKGGSFPWMCPLMQYYVNMVRAVPPFPLICIIEFQFVCWTYICWTFTMGWVFWWVVGKWRWKDTVRALKEFII